MPMPYTEYAHSLAPWGSLPRSPDPLRLTSAERARINANPWFSTLSASVRHDVLRSASVRRYRDGETVAGGDCEWTWLACAKGTLRIRATTAQGRSLTLDYLEPGQWYGEALLMGDQPTHHRIVAQGATTTLHLTRAAFMQIFVAHEDFRQALMLRQRDDTRQLYERVDDLKTLGLAPRLAKALLELAKKQGVQAADGMRIALQLAQKDLAQLLGASRQRVNQQLKLLESAQAIRLGVGNLVIEDMRALQRTVQLAYAE